jgi:hypothetical protein
MTLNEVVEFFFSLLKMVVRQDLTDLKIIMKQIFRFVDTGFETLLPNLLESWFLLTLSQLINPSSLPIS